MKKTIVTGLLILFILGASACTSKIESNIAGDDVTIINPSNDMEAIAKMFPALEGTLETQWEQIRLGSGEGRLPGPADYQYRGYVILSDEAAEKYASSYEWTEAEPDVTFESMEKPEGNWKYSYDFCNDILSGDYSGEVWIDGNTVIFSISTT